MIKSKSHCFKKFKISGNELAISLPEPREATERIKICGRDNEFIRIRSPNSEPPVLRFDGSTHTIAIFCSGYAFKKRCDNSSINDDLPAPPVPVIPKILGAEPLRIKFFKPKSSGFTPFW